jgi:hypothetical protein
MDKHNYEDRTTEDHDLTQLVDPEEQQPATDEQIIDNFSRQLRIKNVQLKLQTVNTALAESRVNELKALTLIAQILGRNTYDPDGKQEQEQEEELREPPHTVTEADIKNFPVLGSIKPGEQVFMSRVIEAQKYADNQKQQEKPKATAEQDAEQKGTNEPAMINEPKQPERKLRKGK